MKDRCPKVLTSKKALSIPVTYLILFVSLIAVISATYSFAIVKISARGAVVRASIAKENLIILDDTVHRVAWSYGASESVSMENCGGTLRVSPSQSRLAINITDEKTLNEEVFSSNIGRVFYELEPSELNEAGFFLKGDIRPIVNQSTSTMTQLYFSADQADRILLNYRPLVSTTSIGSQGGKPSNLIRLSIVNLNSSQLLAVVDRSALVIKSLSVTTATFQYEVDNSTTSVALKANLDGSDGSIWFPLSTNENGATVTCQVVICKIRIQLLET